MAAQGMTAAPVRRSAEAAGAAEASRIRMIRLLTIVAVWIAWEGVARSGWLYEGVVPSSLAVLASVWKHLTDPAFYRHVERTFYEVMSGMAIGTALGLLFGIVIGRTRLLGRVLEIYVNVLAPAPKIVFLPLLMVIFGVDFGSKVAMGAASAFFPVAVATLSAIHLVNPVLIRVAQSFNASVWQLVTKVYLPAMIEPLVSGMRLGLGVAIIGVLLAEIKLSNIGLGHLAIQHYNQFKIADMYAVLLITFALAVGANSLIGAVARRARRE